MLTIAQVELPHRMHSLDTLLVAALTLKDDLKVAVTGFVDGILSLDQSLKHNDTI